MKVYEEIRFKKLFMSFNLIYYLLILKSHLFLVENFLHSEANKRER